MVGATKYCPVIVRCNVWPPLTEPLQQTCRPSTDLLLPSRLDRLFCQPQSSDHHETHPRIQCNPGMLMSLGHSSGCRSIRQRTSVHLAKCKFPDRYALNP